MVSLPEWQLERVREKDGEKRYSVLRLDVATEQARTLADIFWHVGLEPMGRLRETRDMVVYHRLERG